MLQMCMRLPSRVSLAEGHGLRHSREQVARQGSNLSKLMVRRKHVSCMPCMLWLACHAVAR